MKKYFSLLPLVLLYFFAVVQPVQAQSAESKKVYITRTGEKYHTASCRYIKTSGKAVDLSEAVKSYEPCKVCKPSKLSSSDSTNVTTTPRIVPAEIDYRKSSQKSTTSVQCSGTTKAGNRCKRKTTSANGRCYQH